MQYYSYKDYIDNVNTCLKLGYSVERIGISHAGLPIYAIHRGRFDTPQVLLHASIHAREHITSLLLEDLMHHSTHEVGVWYVPMLNPDGVRIATEGVGWLGEDRARFVESICADTSIYKANMRGVDLNVNFDAGWSEGAFNVKNPASQGYVGEYPFSERESVAIRDFTYRVRPRLTISYHSKGEVIYYTYRGEGEVYEAEALEFAKLLSYSLAYSPNSAGGYKDWYLQNKLGMGLTIEIGSDEYEHPYPYSDYHRIYNAHRDIISLCAEVVRNI